MNTCTYSEVDRLDEEIAELVRQIAAAESQKSTPEAKTLTDKFYQRLMNQLKKL